MKRRITKRTMPLFLAFFMVAAVFSFVLQIGVIPVNAKDNKAGSVKSITPKIDVKRTADTQAVISCTNRSGYGVKIYRSDSKKGKYKLVKTTSRSKFTDKKLKKSKTYYYKIRFYTKKGKKLITAGFHA